MEQDKPKNLLILGYTLAICAILVATVVFVDQYLKADVRQEYQKKVLEAPDVDYRNLRAAEDARLGKYAFIDQAKGVVRLSKDRARELVLKEWAARPDGVVQPEVAPTAAPAPAPAPGTVPAPGQTATPGAPTGGTTEPGAVTAPPARREPPGTTQPGARGAPAPAPAPVKKDPTK